MFSILRNLVTKWFGSREYRQNGDPAPDAGDVLPSAAQSGTQPMGFIEATQVREIPYDKALFERACTQWQFGDWKSLAELEPDELRRHPERAKLAVLAAAGCFQTGSAGKAGQLIRLAQDWGVSKKFLSQVLIAGVHNSLGCAKILQGNQVDALNDFRTSVAIGMPGGDISLLAKARANEQLSQLSAALGDEVLKGVPLSKNEQRLKRKFGRKEPLSVTDCRTASRPSAEAELEIGGRTIMRREFRYRDERLDFYFRPDSLGDTGVLKQIFEDKQYDFDWLVQAKLIFAIYDRCIAAGRSVLIVDAGANIGASCVWFQLKFPKASVLAIEPDPENCALLQLNNAGKDVQLFQGGLANERRKLFLNDPGESDWGFRVEASGKCEIDCIGPEDVVDYSDSLGAALLILKLDIEGSEAMVFEGECEWVDSVPLIVIELHDWLFPGQKTSSNFLRVMNEKNFDLVTHGENIFCFNRRFAEMNN
jgi:FkbM family methyltransferase